MTGKWSLVAGGVGAIVLAGLLAVQLGGVPGRQPAQPPGASMAGAIQPQATAGAAELPTRTITVVGQGKASGTPDVARATVGIEVFAPTVAEAARQSGEKMAAIIAELKKLGITDKDIQTSSYSINPERNYDKGGPGEVTGYRVSNMVQVTIRDLNKVGAVLDQVAEAGANSVYGVYFGFDDPAKLETEARAKAVEDAQARADDLAKLNGVQRGDVLTVSEVIGSGSVPIVARAAEMGGGGGTPIQPGELEVPVQVQVTYAMR
jgi:uncharacterized protein YggE